MVETQSQQDHTFAECFRRYEQHLLSCNVLDFDDLISKPTLLLRTNEEVRARWQQRIRYLLVDEYQDTNTSQYELVKWLVGEKSPFHCGGG